MLTWYRGSSLIIRSGQSIDTSTRDLLPNHVYIEYQGLILLMFFYKVAESSCGENIKDFVYIFLNNLN